MDDNTILAEVMCDNHEVFVEEKRKRIEEQGPLKRHETRTRKRRNMRRQVDLYKRRNENHAEKGSRAYELKKRYDP